MTLPRRRHRRRWPRRRRRRPPQLVDDVFGEILLRLPPGDPACLVRAAAVCRTWRRILADPAFPARYRAFHRTPPVLGFFHNPYPLGLARFVPTSSFGAPPPDRRGRHVLGCRHGRVLLEDRESWDLIVWDPATGDERRLPEVPDIHTLGDRNAAVLCAAHGAGCDHRDCHGGPFLVASMGVGDKLDAHAYLFSSETGAWSAPSVFQLEPTRSCLTIDRLPAAVAGDGVCFIGDYSDGILRYDLATRDLSLIAVPFDYDDDIIVTPMEDGELGFACLNRQHRCILSLWSFVWFAGWVVLRVIDLEMLLSIDKYMTPYLSGFAEDANVIFVNTDDGVFTIELESLQTRKIDVRDKSSPVFPYTSFYIPVLCASGKSPPPVWIQ
ncbi:hypothetical protein ACP70R_015219 [Stipagrostis hirtigluma subsp. patula]